MRVQRVLLEAAYRFQALLVAHLHAAQVQHRVLHRAGHLLALAGLELAELLDAAQASAAGRVVSILEGGYSLEGLASGTAAQVRALMGR